MKEDETEEAFRKKDINLSQFQRSKLSWTQMRRFIIYILVLVFVVFMIKRVLPKQHIPPKSSVPSEVTLKSNSIDTTGSKD